MNIIFLLTLTEVKSVTYQRFGSTEELLESTLPVKKKERKSLFTIQNSFEFRNPFKRSNSNRYKRSAKQDTESLKENPSFQETIKKALNELIINYDKLVSINNTPVDIFEKIDQIFVILEFFCKKHFDITEELIEEIKNLSMKIPNYNIKTLLKNYKSTKNVYFEQFNSSLAYFKLSFKKFLLDYNTFTPEEKSQNLNILKKSYNFFCGNHNLVLEFIQFYMKKMLNLLLDISFSQTRNNKEQRFEILNCFKNNLLKETENYLKETNADILCVKFFVNSSTIEIRETGDIKILSNEEAFHRNLSLYNHYNRIISILVLNRILNEWKLHLPKKRQRLIHTPLEKSIIKNEKNKILCFISSDQNRKNFEKFKKQMHNRNDQIDKINAFLKELKTEKDKIFNDLADEKNQLIKKYGSIYEIVPDEIVTEPKEKQNYISSLSELPEQNFQIDSGESENCKNNELNDLLFPLLIKRLDLFIGMVKRLENFDHKILLEESLGHFKKEEKFYMDFYEFLTNFFMSPELVGLQLKTLKKNDKKLKEGTIIDHGTQVNSLDQTAFNLSKIKSDSLLYVDFNRFISVNKLEKYFFHVNRSEYRLGESLKKKFKNYKKIKEKFYLSFY